MLTFITEVPAFKHSKEPERIEPRRLPLAHDPPPIYFCPGKTALLDKARTEDHTPVQDTVQTVCN